MARRGQPKPPGSGRKPAGGAAMVSAGIRWPAALRAAIIERAAAEGLVWTEWVRRAAEKALREGGA